MGRDGTDVAVSVSKSSEAGFSGLLDSPDFSQSGKSSNPANPASDNGPVRFASDTLGVRLWSKQEEVLRAVQHRRRVAVKSGNGPGQGLHRRRGRPVVRPRPTTPAIALCTAPTFRQVRHVLWRQIHRLYRNAADVLGGTMLDTRWDLAEDRFALGLSANDADQFQGFHCDNILVVLDEAEAVAEPIYEAAEAVMTSANSTLLLIGNPTTTDGGFHRAFHRERGIYETITISALESPNVVEGRVVIPGLTTAEWVEERRKIWGEDSEMFRARVMGEFPDRGEQNLIAISDIDDATYPPGDVPAPSDRYEPVVIGVDVARFGPDRSVLLTRRGDVVVDIRVYHGFDITAVAGASIVAARDTRPRELIVDETGLGSGVVDILREQGQPVYGFNGAGKPLKEEVTCANLRAEGYWTLARRFRDHTIRIPRDVELIAELASLRYRYNSRGKVLMESKESMKKRGLPSPDKADALMLAFLETNRQVERPRWMRELFR